jgi:diaminopimelate epimerase
MQIFFDKYQGTGNDFIIMDNRDGNISLTIEQIKKMCDRKFGIGADGLMLLNTKDGYDFEMKYYNSDGNESSMCGNGGRCLVKFAYAAGIRKNKYYFTAIDGEHEASIEQAGWVNLLMKDVQNIQTYKSAFILDTGSPHYVKAVDDIRKTDVVKEGKNIRYNDDFKDEGINVNFVQVNKNGIYVRTYERGVEDETLSCGTGVTAAALVFAHNDSGFNSVEVQTPGGNLAVEFDKTPDGIFTNICLCGPAEFVFKGEINI